MSAHAFHSSVSFKSVTNAAALGSARSNVASIPLSSFLLSPLYSERFCPAEKFVAFFPFALTFLFRLEEFGVRPRRALEACTRKHARVPRRAFAFRRSIEFQNNQYPSVYMIIILCYNTCPSPLQSIYYTYRL